MAKGKGKGRGDIIMGILWLLCLIFLAFPVAFFCAGWYILLFCCEALPCCKCLSAIDELLLKGVQLPNTSFKGFLSGFGCG